VLIDLEGHGREEAVPGADLSRTVGWFTSMFPVRLDAGPLDWDDLVRGGPAAAQALRRVKEQVRAVPGKGVGYGLLRHLHPQAGPALARLPRPGVCFNYLGRFPGSEEDWAMVVEPGAFLDAGDPGLAVAHPLEINALILDAPDGPRLHVTWSWAPALLSRSRVEKLAGRWFDALSGLAACAASGTAGLTPCDLSLLSLGQDEIDAFEEMFSD
jgi:non-ribosomal peptide synthase protein (TIGR01720 family)